MKIYAVWFNNNKVTRVEDVSTRYDELMEGICHHDGEQAANKIEEETGASAVVAARSRTEAIGYAAEAIGLDEVEF